MVASVKFKRLRQRFGINAPRVTVRTHVPWYWRALFIIAVASVSMASAVWLYDIGKHYIAEMLSREGSDEIQSLRNHVVERDGELMKLRSLVGTGESNLQMEREVQRQLTNQLKTLEAENAALREDLAFFEGLMPGSETTDENGIKIDRLKVEPTGIPGEYRYRLLVINNGGRQTKELSGGLQLLLKMQQDGKDVMITIPSFDEKDVSNFRFEIKHFRRMEGIFSVSRDASVLSVEARLLLDGKVRATQTQSLVL